MVLKKIVKKILAMGGYEIRRMVPPVVRPSLSPFPLYDQDSLRTTHNHDFMKDADFMAAYSRGVKADEDRQWHWRVHVGLWAACNARMLEGDFVECGVNRGFLSSAIMRYLDWNTMDKHFYLYDTFRGIDESLFNENELLQGRVDFNRKMYSECYERAKENFSEFKNVHLVRGSIPDTLNNVHIEKVCYLSIDMNCAKPEIESATYFWDKLVPGAIVLLDDYAYVGFEEQHKAFGKFARDKGIKILSLPTGQGLFIKPATYKNQY